MADPAIPDRLRVLNAAEHALVITLRAAAEGDAERLGCARVIGRFCGPEAPVVLQILAALMKRLALPGRREVRLGRRGEAPLTRDEQLILAVFGAAQANACARLSAHLTFLLGREADVGSIAAVNFVADAFRRQGALLRLTKLRPRSVRQPEPNMPRGVWRGRAS